MFFMCLYKNIFLLTSHSHKLKKYGYFNYYNNFLQKLALITIIYDYSHTVQFTNLIIECEYDNNLYYVDNCIINLLFKKK